MVPAQPRFGGCAVAGVGDDVGTFDRDRVSWWPMSAASSTESAVGRKRVVTGRSAAGAADGGGVPVLVAGGVEVRAVVSSGLSKTAMAIGIRAEYRHGGDGQQWPRFFMVTSGEMVGRAAARWADHISVDPPGQARQRSRLLDLRRPLPVWALPPRRRDQTSAGQRADAGDERRQIPARPAPFPNGPCPG